MTKQELKEMREWEYVLHNAYRIVKSAKEKLINAFGCENIEYDERKNEVCYIGEGADDDYLGPRLLVMHHIDEMIEDGWVDIEEEEND